MQACMKRAVIDQISSLAFPAIGTGKIKIEASFQIN